MKLNTNSNTYIIIYSAILVIIVAFLLAFVYKALKPMQDANVELDMKKQILYSLNIRNLDGAEAEAKYAEVVKEEAEKDGQKYYLCEIDGEDILVVALKGMGLWGGISGYISIHGDETPTVYGAYFNHESETAGLGAEIKDSQAWQEKFIGKKVFVDPADGSEVALGVVKKVDDPETQVDCVTGATLTSNGVNDMIKAGLKDAGKNAVELFLKMQCTKEPADSTAVEEPKEVFTNPLNLDHPILGQVLGICSALAVTSQLKPAIVMGLAVTVITAFANVIISIIRNTIPNRIRIVVQLVVVAALVTIVSQILKAFAYDVSVQLSVYVGLIITNCILMGRLEAFAMQNKPWPSFLDGVGNGLGYAMILVIVGAVRELLGRGSLLGFQIIPVLL